jgi:hypothetical protein
MAGAIFLTVRPPTYTADAKILIGTPKPEFIQQQSLLTDAPLDQTQMETQFQILLSKAVLAPIVQKLKLEDDPEFSSPPGGLIGRVFGVFTNSNSPQPKLDPTETAMSALTDRLTINRVGWSRVIEIGAWSRSAEKSAQIANEVAATYIGDQQEAKLQANRTASTWLQERLRQFQGQAAAAERAKVVFKQENNIVSVDGKRMDEQGWFTLTDGHGCSIGSVPGVGSFKPNSILRTWDQKLSSLVRSNEQRWEYLTSSGVQFSQICASGIWICRDGAEWSAVQSGPAPVVELRNRMRLRSSTLQGWRIAGFSKRPRRATPPSEMKPAGPFHFSKPKGNNAT